jgi:hypothetical protein
LTPQSEDMPNYMVNYRRSNGKQGYGVIENAATPLSAAFVARQANPHIEVLGVREIEKDEVEDVGE